MEASKTPNRSININYNMQDKRKGEQKDIRKRDDKEKNKSFQGEI